MATTRTIPVAGTAFGGRRGGRKWRLLAAVGAATLGLGLLAGVLGHGRQASPAALADQRANPYWVYQEDAATGGDPRAAAMALIRVNPYWTYEEDAIVNGNPAEAAMTAFRVNPYWTYREDVILNGNPATVAFPALTPPGPASFPGEDH
jgi:hypothetical protein